MGTDADGGWIAGTAGVGRIAGGGHRTDLGGAINQALHDAMAADDHVLVFGEDVATLGGVFRVTEGLAETFGAERCFDTPLAESAIIGVAVGLAIRGFRPVPEIQFDGFSYPAFDQIVSHLAKYRMRTHGDINMPVTVRIPSFGGIGAVEHHSESTESYWLRHGGSQGGRTVHAVRRVLAAAVFDQQPGPGDLPGAQTALLGA